MSREPETQINQLIEEAIRLLEKDMSESSDTEMAIVHLQIAKDRINQKNDAESWGWSNNT